VLEEVCRVPTHGLAIDEQMNLSFVRDLARKYGKGFGGNLKLTTSLMLGMISPREDALISLAVGGTEGYIFAPGCDIPYGVPSEHLLQAYEARAWFMENYARYPRSS